MIKRSWRSVVLRGVGYRLVIWGRLLLRQSDERLSARQLSTRTAVPPRPEPLTKSRITPSFAASETNMLVQQLAQQPPSPPAHWLEIVKTEGPPKHWLEKVQQGTIAPIALEGAAPDGDVLPTPAPADVSATPPALRHGPEQLRKDPMMPAAKLPPKRTALASSGKRARLENARQAPPVRAQLHVRPSQKTGPRWEAYASIPRRRFRQLAARPLRRWQAFIGGVEARLKPDSRSSVDSATAVRAGTTAPTGAPSWQYATPELGLEDSATAQRSAEVTSRNSPGQVQTEPMRAAPPVLRPPLSKARLESESSVPLARSGRAGSRDTPHYAGHRFRGQTTYEDDTVPSREGSPRSRQVRPYRAKPLQTEQTEQTQWTSSRQEAHMDQSSADLASQRRVARRGRDSLVLEMPTSTKGKGKHVKGKAEPEQFIGLWPALPETPELELEFELEDEIVAGGKVEATYLLWERRLRLDREQEGLRWSV